MWPWRSAQTQHTRSAQRPLRRAGNSHLLWKKDGGIGTFGIPSPDGRHLAMLGWTLNRARIYLPRPLWERTIFFMPAESMSLRDMLFWFFITLFGTGTYVIYGSQSVIGEVLGISMMIVGFIGMVSCAWPHLKDAVKGKPK